MIAQSVDEEILTAIDRSARARVPRLRLNLDDNDYFRARLTNAAPVPSPSKVSHELIDSGRSNAREMSLWSVAQASGSIGSASALRE